MEARRQLFSFQSSGLAPVDAEGRSAEWVVKWTSAAAGAIKPHVRQKRRCHDLRDGGQGGPHDRPVAAVDLRLEEARRDGRRKGRRRAPAPPE